MKKLWEDIKQLEEFRDMKNKKRKLREQELKKKTDDIKCLAFVAQIDKQRNENDVENSKNQNNKTKKQNADDIEDNSRKYAAKIEKNKRNDYKVNRDKVLSMYIQKEMAKVNQNMLKQKKEEMKQLRIQSSYKEENENLSQHRKKIKSLISSERLINKSVQLAHSDTQNVKKSQHRKRGKAQKTIIQADKELNHYTKPTDYKNPEPQNFGGWSEAITDPKNPKLANLANKKMWSRFGYGLAPKSDGNSPCSGNSPDETRMMMKRLTRNFQIDDEDTTHLPLISQRTLKDCKNVNRASIKGSMFALNDNRSVMTEGNTKRQDDQDIEIQNQIDSNQNS